MFFYNFVIGRCKMNEMPPVLGLQNDKKPKNVLSNIIIYLVGSKKGGIFASLS